MENTTSLDSGRLKLILELFREYDDFEVYFLKDLGVIIYSKVKDDETIIILDVFIKKKHRNMGFGKEMLKKFIHDMHKAGYRRITGMVNSDTEDYISAINLYLSFGAKIINIVFESKEVYLEYDLCDLGGEYGWRI